MNKPAPSYLASGSLDQIHDHASRYPAARGDSIHDGDGHMPIRCGISVLAQDIERIGASGSANCCGSVDRITGVGLQQLRLRGECAFIPLEVAQRRRYRRAHLVIRLGQLSVNANT